MRDLLTPKQVARAINVSESSVKRWCDKGVIPTQYTAGGHRRITMAGILDFVRSGKYELANPEALGLPATSGQTTRVVERAREQLVEALIAGDDAVCRQIAVDMYLAEHSVSVLCDDVFAAAFREIGERWSCGEAEVYQERRGCEITLRLLHELRVILPAPPADAPLAIGGATSGDQYSLGTTMAELVLRDAKWNAVSLGDNLPFETLSAAIKQQRPRLFWLSCSHIANESEFLAGYSELYDEFGMDVAFVVGGYALSDGLRQQMKFSAYCDNMQHLEGFAQTLRGAIGDKSAK
ncbi:MAG: helix-turn-helix domain-containing protein [Planctomycetaceae bacterium]|nr:helix-turn-helix domain-containing protein [Planctomycetales bacterium]MCB9920613.1 helix-turn-helix domain-containing protein [Planctomycetaceae bacterium]